MCFFLLALYGELQLRSDESTGLKNKIRQEKQIWALLFVFFGIHDVSNDSAVPMGALVERLSQRSRLLLTYIHSCSSLVAFAPSIFYSSLFRLATTSATVYSDFSSSSSTTLKTVASWIPSLNQRNLYKALSPLLNLLVKQLRVLFALSDSDKRTDAHIHKYVSVLCSFHSVFINSCEVQLITQLKTIHLSIGSRIEI